MPAYKEIEIEQIKPNQYQPRVEFDDEAIEQLAVSIAENGLLQPITVRKDQDGYELIAGERRLRACKKLNFVTIPSFIIEASEVESATLAMIENIQREDLSAIEEANGYLQMLRITGLTQSELAIRVGKKQSTIANKLRLLNLNEEVQKAISEKKISERHGRALLSLSSSQQSEALKHITEKELNVKQSEEYVTSHFLSEPKRKSKMRCFGVATRLVINSFRETYKKVKGLTENVSLKEEETEESYIMTITIKK